MNELGSHNAVWLGDGEWIHFDKFGECHDYDPDEEHDALLPVLEAEDKLSRRFPLAGICVIRQVLRLTKASTEYFEQTGKHLNIYGALGELYGSMVWGVRLHNKPNAQGSDGKLDNDFVEIKTIAPNSTTNKVKVKLSGHFNKLLIVKIQGQMEHGHGDVLRMSSRMIDRRALTRATSGGTVVPWSRACELGVAPPE
ncbi:hypothetical protein [Gymnodinialimonas ceratoperidinii]|uniref:Uncharacterized protein n=1 Tax=Gymnodinialimonas ceratoperidinii TaxID=2856823 RepID=A0A8F6TZX8_9RHOB|nr:hypothetical protein [Gymnodinialimonas ceratoperidinii]QXT40817.1 hypothetical protein KYE46_06180 [Gymnodinialimonas ceratoperidinii]